MWLCVCSSCRVSGKGALDFEAASFSPGSFAGIVYCTDDVPGAFHLFFLELKPVWWPRMFESLFLLLSLSLFCSAFWEISSTLSSHSFCSLEF